MSQWIIDSTILDDYREAMGEEGDEFVRDLVNAFIEDTHGLAEKLATSWKAKDRETFERSAHSLKASSKTMGASLLSAQFEQLEYHASLGDLDDEKLYKETMSALEEARTELTHIYLE